MLNEMVYMSVIVTFRLPFPLLNPLCEASSSLEPGQKPLQAHDFSGHSLLKCSIVTLNSRHSID